jgi:hypothetical protein
MLWYEACLLQLDSVAQTKAHALFKGYETCSAIKDTKICIERFGKLRNMVLSWPFLLRVPILCTKLLFYFLYRFL